jgi:alkanesulfonate monooxygenase SsuD/methylene tetrahydromethanopterin reductase-like flavin-dependent oxidoreductase (luciferase family)
VKLGLILPTIGHGAGPNALDAAAETASRLGWHSVWATDHLLVPAGPEADEYGWTLEATTALTWVAARSPSLRVGFSVLIPAMRDAPLLAKQLATIDVLTDGRLTVGVGVSDKGDLPEYENLGKGDRFPYRGAYVDEAIALWRHLWSGRTDPFEGEFNQLRDFNFQPLPVQGADMPIWCGGRSDRALRRAATLCDGYHAAQTGPADVADKLPKLREAAEAAGRMPVPVSVRVRVRFDQDPLAVYSLHGTSAAMLSEVLEFARLGVEELVVVFKETDPDRLALLMERFDDEVYRPARDQLRV